MEFAEKREGLGDGGSRLRYGRYGRVNQARWGAHAVDISMPFAAPMALTLSRRILASSHFPDRPRELQIR